MAFPARTWVTAEVVTDTIMNSAVRDTIAAGVPDIFTAEGDTAHATAADTAARLAKGNVADFYRQTSTVPEWADPTDGAKLDGDLIDIDYAQSNYTPATTGVAVDVDDLSAHLEGIDDKLGLIGGTPLIKTADVTINDDDVLTDDTDMTFSIGANERWLFILFVRMTTRTAPDFKLGWSFPTNCIIKWQAIPDFVDSVSVDTELIQTTVPVLLVTANDKVNLMVWVGVILNGANAGTLAMQWAQNTSNSGNTTLHEGSWLMAWQK